MRRARRDAGTDRVAAALRLEEGGAEVAVGEQHGAGPNGRQQQQERVASTDHANSGILCSVMPGAYLKMVVIEVDRTEDRRGAGDVTATGSRGNHRRTRLASRGERRIDRPAAADAVAARRFSTDIGRTRAPARAAARTRCCSCAGTPCPGARISTNQLGDAIAPGIP